MSLDKCNLEPRLLRLLLTVTSDPGSRAVKGVGRR